MLYMEISAGSVPNGPNLGMNKNIYTEYMKSKYVRIYSYIWNICQARFSGWNVLDSVNMVISGMKTTFYTKYMKSKYVRITNGNIGILLHSGGNIYIYV